MKTRVMLDKFQKLFGPNKPATDVSDIGLAYSTTDAINQKNKAARVAAVRRRIFGSIAFVLFLCAVLPWVFEPDEDYSNRGAITEIPLADKSASSSQRMALTKKEAKVDASARAEEVARNLSQANPTPAAAQKKDVIKEEEKKLATKTEAKKASTQVKATAATKKVEQKTKTEVKKAEATTKATQGAKANGTYYYIQIVATSNRTSATEKANRIRKLGLPVYIEKTQRHQADIWRVRVGRFDTLKKANIALDKLALNSVTNGGIMTEKPAKK